MGVGKRYSPQDSRGSTVEEDTAISRPYVILGLDPRIQTQACQQVTAALAASAPHPPAGTFSPQAGRRPKRPPLAPPSPRLRGEGRVRGKATHSKPTSEEKGDAPQRFLNKIRPPHIFSSPPISTPLESTPSRPRIHLTMRCQARRGRRRGSVLSQAQIPGPLQRSPSGRGAGNEGDGVGCSRHRIP
ncbi:hypothetical protein J2X08_003155 [Rhizobium rosettiformans]|nr:hypothetical protein [Rhizobium rosettiformans]MDR7065641.1 hypothetical protein [Rhizobium rosettiformans]